jgi:beta-lactamase regulating signal transducer with metallopeptidase domain
LNAQRLAVPFKEAASIKATATIPWDEIVIVVWGLGVCGLLLNWALRWRQLRVLVRSSPLLPLAAPVPVRSAPSTFEPGLVGILRPVLLLPQRLADKLSLEEVESILAHELCHLRRRDNLTYGIHLLAQTIFWFYPPIWWLGKRLLAERERACDEAVLAAGHEPRIYVESILKVSRFYIGAPVVGIAGVSGLDLKERVRGIMEGCRTIPINAAQKALVGAVATVVIALPVGFGLLLYPVANAQGAGSRTPQEIAREDYEQSRPQKEVPFDSKDFDKYVGYYQFAPMYFAHVVRENNRYYFDLTDDDALEIFPESATKFFSTIRVSQVRFVSDATGGVSGLVLYRDGFLRPAKRVAESVATRAEAELRQRIRNDVPSPETEAYARRMIDGMERGEPDYDDMGPVLAYANQLNLARIRALMLRLGKFESVAFDKVAANGWDVYEVTFAHARVEYNITPLAFSSDGKITAAYFGQVP